jgi:branched-chain amino acid transport system substrate-binding protein
MLVVAMLPFVGGCAPEAAPTPAPTPTPTPAPTPAPEKEPVKIGALLNFSGPVADMGPRFLNGIELALEEANYEAGGRSIELIVEDTASDPTIALEKQKKLVETDGCYLAIGPLMGDQQLAVAPYAAENKVLRTSLINGLAEDVEYGTVLMYPTTCLGQQRAPMWYCYDELGYRTTITMGSDYAGGHGYINGAVYGFEEKGGEVVQQTWIPIGTPDFSPYFTALEDADVITFFSSSGEDAGRFMLAYKESGVTIPVFQLIHEVFTPAQLQELGDKVLGLTGQSTYCWTRDDPVNNAFVAAFKAKYGIVPSIEQNAYTMAKVLLAGLEATGGDDSYEAMRSAILGMEINTPQGPLSWTPEGVAVTDIYIVEIQKVAGENVPVIIKTYRDATDDPFVKKIGQ